MISFPELLVGFVLGLLFAVGLLAGRRAGRWLYRKRHPDRARAQDAIKRGYFTAADSVLTPQQKEEVRASWEPDRFEPFPISQGASSPPRHFYPPGSVHYKGPGGDAFHGIREFRLRESEEPEQ